MLQENSFFSSPLTYFGTHPNVEEEDEEWEFEQLQQIYIGGEIDLQQLPQRKIGLFLYWADLS